MRPLLLLDVDGVLNPDFPPLARRERMQDGDWVSGSGWDEGRGVRYPLFLNKNHGPLLITTAIAANAELAWATTWNQAANIYVGPVIGLPELPVLYAKRWAKPETVIPATEGRPFVWLDDEEYVIGACAGSHGSGLRITPEQGLTEADLERAVELLASGKKAS